MSPPRSLHPPPLCLLFLGSLPLNHMCPLDTGNERYINRAAEQLGCLSPWGDHRDFMHRIFKFYFIIWTMHAWSLQRPERVLGPLELELHIVVSHPVGPRKVFSAFN